MMILKKEIHPGYGDVEVTCACGNIIRTRSTVAGSSVVEICSKCHPFYTGKQKIVDTGGRVERFKKRLNACQNK